MEKVGWRERLSYRFDNWMSRGTGAIMALLAIATGLFVLLIAVVVGILGAYPDGDSDGEFWDIAWGNLMRTLDPGTMGGDTGWGYRFLMLVVTIGGLVIVASLIGIVSGAFDNKMLELRKGRSKVIESGHTVILGWNNQLFSILAELCIANASNRRNTIVVLANRDKVEMEDEIRAKVSDTASTTIICRHGDRHSPLSLNLVSPTTARSIVVLPDDDDDPHPDVTVIKTVLALLANDPAEDGTPIVAELRDPSNLDAARLAGRSRARWVLAGELIDRMTIQTCLQPGLSSVCTELLDFSGDEIYFTPPASLIDRTFHEAQLCFPTSTLIGLARGEAITLNPPKDTVIAPHDDLILIAEDDSGIEVASPGSANPQVICHAEERFAEPERTLMLGYHSSVPGLLHDLGAYVPPGSLVSVVADQDIPPLAAPDGLKVETVRADTTSRAVLENLDVGTYDHVLVLAYRDALATQAADARTLVTLLHLRDIANQAGIHLSVVSEMLDDRNRELAEVTRPDDFIVSDRLASLLLAQVSENRTRLPVFEELFTTGGNEVYVRPAALYVEPGVAVDFYTVVEAAARRGETAIGFRIAAEAHSIAAGYGVRLNPDKREYRSYTKDDSVIVLAEDA